MVKVVMSIIVMSPVPIKQKKFQGILLLNKSDI